jgi:hypothetical protein
MSLTAHCHCQTFVLGSRPEPTPRNGTCRMTRPPDPNDTADFELLDQQALIDAFTAGLIMIPVKAKKETVPRRGGQGAPGRAAQSRTQRRGAAARPVGRPASGRRAAAWRPQTDRPTGRAAAPRTMCPGLRCPARCAAEPRNWKY